MFRIWIWFWNSSAGEYLATAVKVIILLLDKMSYAVRVMSHDSCYINHTTWAILKTSFSLIQSKLGHNGISLIILYFVSIEKPEFNRFADKLSVKTNVTICQAMAWSLIDDDRTRQGSKLDEIRKEIRWSRNFCWSYDNSLDTEDEKIAFFILEYCKGNDWDLIEWLKIQTKKIKSLSFKLNMVIK